MPEHDPLRYRPLGQLRLEHVRHEEPLRYWPLLHETGLDPQPQNWGPSHSKEVQHPVRHGIPAWHWELHSQCCALTRAAWHSKHESTIGTIAPRIFCAGAIVLHTRVPVTAESVSEEGIGPRTRVLPG